MGKNDNTSKIQLLVAVIGLVGVLGAALIANWKTFFPSQENTAIIQPQNGEESSPQSSPENLPDLAILNWSIEPSTPLKQSQIDVHVIVENIGQGPAESFDVAWWPGVNFPMPHKWTVNGLKVGHRKDLWFRYRGYVSWYAELNTKVEIDPDGSLPEISKSNNKWERTVVIKKSHQPLPDLSIVSWAIDPISPFKQSLVDIRVRIENTGSEPAGSFKVAWWPGVRFPSPHVWVVKGLQAGEHKDLSFRYPGYQSSYSSIETKIVVDPENAITESHKVNNEWNRKITVRETL